MDFQLAIVGGGPAGYTAAECAGKLGMSVVLFEKNSLGGVCLNEGCIPTKTLLYSAKVSDTVRNASKYAVGGGQPEVNLPKVISRKAKVVRRLVLGIKARLSECRVEIVAGEARIVDRNTVECNGETYRCESMILATGSETLVPPIPGLDKVAYWTHREALDCKTLPQSLTIVGGGVIGMEFASFFNSLGVQVTVIEMLDEILRGIDRELAGMLRAEYAKRGVRFLLKTKVTDVDGNGPGEIRVNYENEEGHGSVVSEKMLLSVGRRPVMKGFGLENLGLELTERGNVKVDSHLETSVPGVYACGDLNGVSLLAHTAVKEAETAVGHIAGRGGEMSYGAIPSVVYTNPEVASVGKDEETLKKEGVEYQVIRLPMAFSGRFVAENEGVNGTCKALVGGDGRMLGMHILGNPASELIVMAGMMIEDGRKLSEWKRYVFPHPTVGEIFREL